MFLGAGNYTCEVEWSDQLPLTVTHHLEVQVPASIEYVRSLWPVISLGSIQPHGSGGRISGAVGGVSQKAAVELGEDGVIEVREGDNVSIECKGQGIPMPTIKWVRTELGL